MPGGVDGALDAALVGVSALDGTEVRSSRWRLAPRRRRSAAHASRTSGSGQTHRSWRSSRRSSTRQADPARSGDPPTQRRGRRTRARRRRRTRPDRARAERLTQFTKFNSNRCASEHQHATAQLAQRHIALKLKVAGQRVDSLGAPAGPATQQRRSLLLGHESRHADQRAHSLKKRLERLVGAPAPPLADDRKRSKAAAPRRPDASAGHDNSVGS